MIRLAQNSASEVLVTGAMETVNVMPETEREDVLQCLNTITQVRQGSVPMCRDVGINSEPLHRRENVARALITRDIFVAVRDQETRATADQVTFEASDREEILRPVLEVTIHG